MVKKTARRTTTTRRSIERNREEKTILSSVDQCESAINIGTIRRRRGHSILQTIDNVDASPAASLSTNGSTKRNG